MIIAACAQVTGINLKKHEFSLRPEKIVWIQIAGLHEEHFSWIHFDPDEKVTSFNNFLCFGKAWNYTLKDLRHNSTIGFRVQDTGKASIKGTCEDFSEKPVWSYLKEKGFQTGILEIDSNKDSTLVSTSSCNSDVYLQDAYLWVSKDKLKAQADSFHADLKQDYQIGKTYFDKSCFNGTCVSSRIQNVEKLYNWLKTKDDNHLFILKDYGFEKAMKQKKYADARRILRELNRIVESFLIRSEEDNTLLLVTGTSSIGVEVPEQGIKLKNFLDRGLGAQYRKTMLLSPILANGARAENFCGVYKESDIVKRIFSKPTQSDKKYIFINPFESF